MRVELQLQVLQNVSHRLRKVTSKLIVADHPMRRVFPPAAWTCPVAVDAPKLGWIPTIEG